MEVRSFRVTLVQDSILCYRFERTVAIRGGQAMFLRTIDNHEIFWEYIQEGMLHLPKNYNPQDCPLLQRVLERLHLGTSQVMLVIGQTRSRHVGKLACPPVHLAVHYWAYSKHTIVIDFVLASIPYHDATIRPWVVAESFRDWFQLLERNNQRVLIGIQPEMRPEHQALNTLWRTAQGSSQRRVIDGQYFTLYQMTPQWCDTLITVALNDSGLRAQEQQREFIPHTTSLKLRPSP